jgi:hypothetical protein
MENFDIKQKIVADIKLGKLTMLSGAFIKARRAAFMAFLALALGGVAYSVSLVMFKFYLYDPFDYLSLGPLGWNAFYGELPWKSLVLLSIFLVLGAIALRYIDWSRQKSAGAFFSALTAGIAVIAVLVNAAGVHQAFRDRQSIPYLYHGQFIGPYWVMGRVTVFDATTQTMSVLTPNNEPAMVAWGEDTVFSKGSDLRVGDMVQVVGDSSSGIYLAEGIVITEQAK